MKYDTGMYKYDTAVYIVQCTHITTCYLPFVVLLEDSYQYLILIAAGKVKEKKTLSLELFTILPFHIYLRNSSLSGILIIYFKNWLIFSSLKCFYIFGITKLNGL